MSDFDTTNVAQLLQQYFGLSNPTQSVRALINRATNAVAGQDSEQSKRDKHIQQQRKQMNSSDYNTDISNSVQYESHINIVNTQPYVSDISNQYAHNKSLQCNQLPSHYIQHKQCQLNSTQIPNTLINMNNYHARVFCSTYNRDGTRMSIASQDAHVRIHNTSSNTIQNSRLSCAYNVNDDDDYDNSTQWSTIKDIECRNIGWSIIDTDFSPDGESSVYSTWSNYVQLVNVSGDHDIHESLDLCPTNNRFCVFSVKFNSNGQQILCGCSDSNVYLYDIVTKQRLFCVNAHTEDVNNVCWCDDSSNVFVSGSDDSCIRIWDTRSLSNDSHNPESSRVHISRHNIPVGSLIGHTDGITYIDSKYDGRYLVSNGKDQCAKLWDIRKAQSATASPITNSTQWDYRWSNRNMYHRHNGVRRPGTRANPSSSDAEEYDDSDDSMEFVLDEEVIEETDDDISDDDAQSNIEYIYYDGDGNHTNDTINTTNDDAIDTEYDVNQDDNNHLTQSDERRMDSDDQHEYITNQSGVDDDDDDVYNNHDETSHHSSDSTDSSIMTYKGHRVLDTLIRIRFSPSHTTAQQYIYTGSQDGDCWIYNALTGKCIQKLSGVHRSTIRDVSWHPYLPQIMTSGWDGIVANWRYRSSSSGGRRSSTDSNMSQY